MANGHDHMEVRVWATDVDDVMLMTMLMVMLM